MEVEFVGDQEDDRPDRCGTGEPARTTLGSLVRSGWPKPRIESVVITRIPNAPDHLPNDALAESWKMERGKRDIFPEVSGPDRFWLTGVWPVCGRWIARKSH